jgi:hypothetical protein
MVNGKPADQDSLRFGFVEDIGNQMKDILIFWFIDIHSLRGASIVQNGPNNFTTKTPRHKVKNILKNLEAWCLCGEGFRESALRPPPFFHSGLSKLKF